MRLPMGGWRIRNHFFVCCKPSARAGAYPGPQMAVLGGHHTRARLPILQHGTWNAVTLVLRKLASMVAAAFRIGMADVGNFSESSHARQRAIWHGTNALSSVKPSHGAVRPSHKDRRDGRRWEAGSFVAPLPSVQAGNRHPWDRTPGVPA
jgi:hypothetical protein